jgi:biotin transporter BioY
MALVLLGGASYLALISGLSFTRTASLAILPFVAGELVKACLAAGLAGARGASRRDIV